MSVLPKGLIPSADTGYEIDNSLRFNDDDSPYLSWTPSSAGNRRTWTWSGWVKNDGTGTLFSAQNTDNNSSFDSFNFNDQHLRFFFEGSSDSYHVLTAFSRDPSAWSHILLAVDTTLSTSADRVKLYINGVRVTDFSSETAPSQNYQGNINSTRLHRMSSYAITGDTAGYLDGYLAEVNFIDGQQLTPSDFGEFGDYGEWKPIKYAGTYGTNGFYLDFKTSGTLGNDASSNSNNWTTNNLAASDQMVDTPTNNFCTLNGVTRQYTGGGANSEKRSEGNLKLHALATNGVSASAWGSIPLTNGGKWYWEVVTQTATSNRWVGIGDDLDKAGQGTYIAAARTYGVFYKSSGVKSIDEAESAYGASYTTGDVIGVALDMDNNNIYFSKNGTWQNSGVPTSGATGTGKANTSALEASVLPSLMTDPNGTVVVVNFGQDSSFAGNKTAQGNSDSGGVGDFYYTPPSGFLALCTKNLPDPVVIPSEHFNTVTYTGTGGGSQIITGVGFQPDFIWLKMRNSGWDHHLWDSVRGVGSLKGLSSNNMNSESGNDTANSTWGYIDSIDSDGFTTYANGSFPYSVHQNNFGYVAWFWKAGGTAVSNTSGSITSSVSANTDAGFSIVMYTGVGTNGATVGHGLSKAPEMVLIKQRTTGGHHWKSIMPPLGAGKALYLNLTNGPASGQFNNTLPDSTKFTLDTDTNCNESSASHIAYAFHSVDGYSKVGLYKGNGNTDGTFVYLGFKPAYMLVKNVTSSAEEWVIIDNKRHPINDVNTPRLLANRSGAESEDASIYVDYLSNGFKIRATQNMMNTNGYEYIYLAFAEQPFKHSNAR